MGDDETRALAVSHDQVAELLRDDELVRVPASDPQLEALHRAILLEDVFGVTLVDHEIDQATLASPRQAYQVVSGHLREP